jgi:hypothetical protein
MLKELVLIASVSGIIGSIGSVYSEPAHEVKKVQQSIKKFEAKAKTIKEHRKAAKKK